MPLSSLKAQFSALGQSHIFEGIENLNSDQVKTFCSQLESVDLDLLQRLIGQVKQPEPLVVDFDKLKPPPVIRHPDLGGDAMQWGMARTLGEAALKAGEVGVLTVAGGQGTRLGYDGPKGTVPVTPLKNKPLFQVFAEKILAAQRRYERTIPWFIMTSPVNHSSTQAFFKEHDFFGLASAQVYFFTQSLLPSLDFEGRLILEAPGCLAMVPGGHGGVFKALFTSGALARMSMLGIRTISYFQVDNPLVSVVDPAFIGFHLQDGADISSKMVRKKNPEEKVGILVEEANALRVLEYSDAPVSLLEKAHGDGALVFDAGSIAVHLIQVDFAEFMALKASIPYHQARKKITQLRDGKPCMPAQPNGIKFEQFIFDALPLAKETLVLEVLRSEQFSPVKNATGVDSIETAKAHQLDLWRQWLNLAGENVLPDALIEVSPLWADSADTFCGRYQELSPKPNTTEPIYLG